MEKSIKDLGLLTGDLLIFGGVYSNLQALQQLFAIAQQKNIPPTNIICTGDIVGYCAQPQECVEFIRDWGIHCIAGNVELQLANDEEDCGCNFKEGSRCFNFSNLWYPYAKLNLNQNALNFMKSLPHYIQFKYGIKNVFVLHGSFDNTSEFIFKSTAWEKKQKVFDQTKSNVILAGHCGLPFNQYNQNYYWLNAGVIGMPANNGDSSVWYMLLNDTDGLNFLHHQFSYNYIKTMDLMEKNNLPKEYIQTLQSGLWDNVEILPVEEAKNQGKPLFL